MCKIHHIFCPAPDLTKIDRHVITPEEYDESPELTGDEIDHPNTTWWIGKERVSPAQGKAAFRELLNRSLELTRQEESASLQLDADVLAAFQATGADWRQRANEVLRAWVRRQRG